MKKKNKVIIGALSTIGIGSMVIAPALAFANNQSPNNKDATSQTSTKKATTASLATTPVTTINSHTFNDDAYLQTLNQTGITNPVGKVWTVQSSLSYFKSHLQNDINVFNCATIFRWVVIQNFNYNLNELIGTLSANNNFKVDVPNFNYTLSNIKNNGDIANFSCTLNVTIDFVITSKNDGATLSFTNNYTYNNLKYTPTITTNGYNGYGAFALSNNANGTLTVNNTTYFGGMQLSGNWTNSDFSNLLKVNWLPTINPSTSITTSNYTYALADMVQRASHSVSLNNNQSQFMSILPTTMIDTFNLGYKFDNAASIAIVMNTKGITPNANNDYTIFPGTTVTLSASQTLSSINLKNPNLAYQWEELSNGTWTNIGGATTTTYTFPVGSSTSQYRLYVYNTKNASFNLTSNSIAINPTVQNLTIDSISNTSSYNYGSSCTLQINQKNSDYDSNSVTSYQWYVNTTNSTSGGSIIKTATKDKYKFDVTSANYYYLVLTFSNGTTLTSNAYYVTPSQSTVSVENLTPSTSMTSNGQIYNGSEVTLGISKSDMDWIKTGGGKNLTYTWYQYNPYATSANDQWEEVGTSSANNPGQFSFTINQGDAANNQFVKDSQGKYKVVITNSQNPNYNLSSTPISLTTDGTVSLIPSINGQQISPNNSNYYSEPYGSKVGISVEGNHWNTTGWKYQWQYYDQATGEWENVTGTGATSPNYTYELNGMNHSTYRLEINDGNIHMDSNPISVSANKPTISVSSTNETTGKTVTGPIQQGDKVTMSPSINGVSPDSKITWKYQWQDQNSDGQTQDIPGATSPTCTIPANKNGTYRLKITNPADPNNPIYSPWQSVNVTNNYPLVIEANTTSSTSSSSSMNMVANSFEYNDNITLSMNTSDGNWDNQPKLTDLTYSWYEVGVSNPLLSSSTATTYNFTLTQNGNEYYLVITDPSGFKLTSNPITINYETAIVGISADQVNNGVATPLTNPNDITQGTTVKLDINSGNLPNTKNLTYQWQYLKDGKTWTTVSSGSSPYQFNATNATAGSYKLVITNSDNKVVGSSNVINIGLAHHPLYIANETNSTSSSTTSSSSSSSTTVPSSINANYNQSNIKLGISGYWQNQKDVNSSNFQYQWQEQTQGSTTWTNIKGATDSTYKVPPVTTSGTSYRLVITDSKDSSFNLTSSPLSVTLNKANVVIEATSPTSGSTYSFGNNVTLSINKTETTGIDLSSNYTYVWQYQNANGNFVTFPQTTNSDTLAFAIIRNSVFRLEIKSGDFTVYSTNQLTLNCTTPAATIRATDASSSTPATSFNPLTNITLTASSLSVPSGVTLGYSWANLSNSSDKLTSATSTQTYFLISPLTAQVIYELSDANNAYYDYSFNSSPISINVNKQALVIGSSNTDKASSTASSSSSKDATSVAETPSNTYNIGSTVKLSIGLANYWDTYSQDNLPTGYKLKFQWFDNQTGDAISSATNPSYSFTLNKTTAHGYYLEISCVDANGDVVYSIKSNTINVSMFIPSLTIIASNNSSTSSTSATTTQNSFTTYYGQAVTLSIPSNSTWLTSPISGQTYQWQMWDATSNSWSNLTKNPSTTYTTYTDDATTTGIYRLQIVADGSIINSNSLTVIVSGLSNKVSIGIKDNTNNATSFNYGTSVTLQETSIASGVDLTGAKYAWQEQSGTSTWTTISGESGSISNNTIPPYTFNVTSSNIYRLQITLANGVILDSNDIGINVKSIMFAIDTVSGANSFAYGTSATLQINKDASNYNTSTSYTYQWYSNTTSATTGGTLIKGAKQTTYYKIDNVTKASYYYLVVKDGTNSYTSNSWYITPTTSTINISYDATATSVVKQNTVYAGAKVSLSLSSSSTNVVNDLTGLTYDWYQVNPQDPSTTGLNPLNSSSATTYSFNATSTGTYVLVILGSNGIDLISNPLTIAVDNTLTLTSSETSSTSSTKTASSTQHASTIALMTENTPSAYSYGENITLSPTSGWATYFKANSNFTYAWYQFENGGWTPISSAANMTYSFDAYQNGSYELVATDGTITKVAGTINVSVMAPTATITATAVKTTANTFDFGSDTSSITSATGSNSTNTAIINWGQSVDFSASLSGATLSSNWTYTWQYLNPGANEWAPITGTTANESITGATITSQELTCYQSGTYRIELINKADESNPIYSGIVSINVMIPSLGINVNSTTSASFKLGKGTCGTSSTGSDSSSSSSQSGITTTGNTTNSNNSSTSNSSTNSNSTAPIVLAGIYGDSYTISIDSGNYWLSKVSDLTGLTYTWYKVGDKTALVSGATDTSYTITSLTSSGSYYCVVTDSNDSSFSLKSNIVTINMQTPTLTITSSATTANYGASVSLDYSSASFTIGSTDTYVWEVLGANGWTAITGTNATGTGAPTSSTKYTFNILQSGTYRLEIKDSNGDVIANSNEVSINVTKKLPDLTATGSVSNTVTAATTGSYIYHYDYEPNGKITISIDDTYSAPTGATYQWLQYKDGSWTPISDQNGATLIVDYTNGEYEVTITAHNLGVDDNSTYTLTSNPIIITNNTATVTLSASAVNSATSPYKLGTKVTLTATGNNITLNNTDYKYVWQYQNSSGSWQTFPQTTNADSLSFDIDQSCNFQVEVETTDGTIVATSAPLYVQMAPVAITLSSSLASSTSGTKGTTANTYSVGSIIDVSATGFTSASDWTVTTSWQGLTGGTASEFDNYVLGKTTTFEVSYKLTDASNSYYNGITFSSSALTVTADSSVAPLSITDVKPATTASTIALMTESNDTVTDQTVSDPYYTSLWLGLSNPSYWSDYAKALPSGYTLSYQWYQVTGNTATALNSTNASTDTLGSFYLDTKDAGTYYFIITCKNSSNTIFTIKSNTYTFNVKNEPLTIGTTTSSNTFATSSYETMYGTSVPLSIDSTSYWFTNTANIKYQWTDLTTGKTVGPDSATYQASGTSIASYQLTITFPDGYTITSNPFTVYYQSSTTNQITISSTGPYYVGESATIKVASLGKYSLDSNDTWTWYINGAVATGNGATGTGTPTSYTIRDLTKGETTYQVQLKVEGPSGSSFELTSNVVTITPVIPQVVITTKSGDNSFAYGTTATLQENTNATNIPSSYDVKYEWFSSSSLISNPTYDTLSKDATLLNGSTDTTLSDQSVTVVSANYYYLAISNGTDWIISNTYFITPTSQKITITYTTSSTTDVVQDNTVYYGSSVTLKLSNTDMVTGLSGLTYTWYQVNPQDPSITGTSAKKVSSSDSYTFDAIATGTYVLNITGSNGFNLISNPLTIAVDNSLSLTSTASTTASSNQTTNIALLDLSTTAYGYGASVTLRPSSAWNSYLTAGVNKANFTYQWYQLENGSWSKIASAISLDYNFDIYQSGTYELKITYKNGDVTGTFTGSINVPVTIPTATITATPTSTGVKGWVTSSYDANTKITNISSKTGSTDYATINWGQSVTFNATLSDANLNSGWTATWQYLDPTSDSWQPINTNTENVSLTGTAISSITYTCDQTGTYRIELVNSADSSIKIYSGIISINVNTPKVAIGVNTSATSNTINEIGKCSSQSQPQTLSSTGTFSSNPNSNNGSSTATNSNSTAPIALAGIYGDSYTISIDSGNYWLSSVSGLSNVTYSWYEVGNSSPLLTDSSDTSYTISSLTSSGSYYCTVQADGKTFTSNTVTINMQAIDVTISTTATNPVTFGTKVELTSKLSNINSTLPTGVTYQWQYLNGTSWENVPATSNLDASSGAASTYSFTITHSNTYRLILQAKGRTIATSSTAINLICNTDPFALSATASNDQSGTNFVNGSKVTITPAASSTIYQDYTNALGTKITYAWYSQTGAIQSTSTVYTGESSDSLSFDLTSTTAGTYYLVISDSTIGFKVQSYPITINPTTSSINLSAKAGSNTWSTDGTQWSSTDAVSFASSVTLTAAGSTGMNLSSGYSFTWYFIDSSGQWTEYGTTTTPTLTINAVRNSNFKVVATNNTSKDSWTSATIYVGIINPTVSITASANSKTGTSFDYASWLILDSTVDPTIISTDGSWTYAWTEVGQTKPFSTLQDTNWLLTANSTFEVTYSYAAPSADTSSYYQGISFTSQPTYIKVMMSSSSSSSSSGTSSSGTTSGQTGTSNGQNNVINPVITASESSVSLGQSTTLSLKKDSYWATYSFPSAASGYSFTYTWMSASTNAAISSSATGTFDTNNEGDLSYKLPALSATGSYYLVITCENSSKDTVFSVRSNVMQINVTNPTITIGYAQSPTVFDTTSTSVNQGNKVTIEVQPSQTTPYWYSMCKYQWVSYDVTTQSWTAPSDADWTTVSASSTISEEVGVGSYKLAVQIDGVIVYSNSFIVSENKAGRSITITQPASVAYGQDVTLSATNMGFTSAGDWTFSWEVLNNSTGKYEPISDVFTAGTYTVNDSSSADSLTINNVISSYTFEVVATSTNTKLASVTSNQVTINYTDVTLDISSNTISYKYNATGASAISIDSTKTTWKAPYDVKTSDLVYQWYENGTAIKGANTDSYTPSTTLIGTTSYYLEITSTATGLSTYQVKSNTITITVDQPAITIKSNQTSTSIDFGTQVTLSSTLTNVASLPSGVTYQWQYLDNGTWKNAPATTNIDGTGATSDKYSFTITSDNTYQLVLVDESSTIATSNVLTLSCVDTPLTLTASANGKSGISFANGSDVTITPMSGNIYQKTLPSKDITYAWYNSKGEIVNSDTSYTGYNASSLKFTLNATTAGSYYLKITDSTIGFSITSTPITININNSNVSLQAQVGTTATKWTSSTWNASKDTVAFATFVTLTAEGNGIDLSSGYTFAWQFLDNGVWTTYPGATKDTLTINAVRSTSFQVVVTNSTSGAQWTSNTIYVGITTTKPTISVTSGSSTTAATSFKYASYLNLNSSMPTLASGDGSWASYAWTELGQAKPFSDKQDTNWLLTANTTFEVTYTYAPTSTNSTNPYYENITFTSDPANITLMMNSTSSSSSSSSASGTTSSGTSTNSNGQSAVINPAIMASESSVELGQSSKLSLNSDNYWATYTFPSASSGYTFTYAWMDTANNTTLSSGTFDSSNEKDLSYQLSALASTGSYYLVITCMDGKNTVFSVRSNVVQVVVTTPTITIGTMNGTTFDTSSISVLEGNTVSLTLLSSDEKDAWYTSGNYKYQWLTYDPSTSSWPSPSTTGWQTPGKDGIPANPVDAGSYILAIQIARVIVKSNIFTVYYQSSTANQIMIGTTTAAPFYVGSSVSVELTSSLTKYNLSSSDTWTWIVNGKSETGADGTGTGATVNNYTIGDLAKGTTYTVKLTITGPHGVDLTSNTITITPVTPTLQITTESGDNSFVYGSSATLEINKTLSQYDTSASWKHQWYENSTNSTSTTSATKLGTGATQTITSVTSAGYYFLVMTDGNNSYISNAWYITPTSKKITIDYKLGTNGEQVSSTTNAIELYWGSAFSLSLSSDDSWAANQTGWTYNWYNVNPADPNISDLSPVSTGSDSYSSTAFSSGSYELVITNSKDSSFKLISNIITVTVNNNIALSASATSTSSNSTTKVATATAPITYSFDYGSEINIAANSTWSTYLSKLSDLTYTWYQLDTATGQWSTTAYKTTSSPSLSDMYVFANGTYHLVITDGTHSFTTQPITIALNKYSITIGSTIAPNETDEQFTIVPLSVQSVTGLNGVSTSDATLTGWTYTWQYYDANTQEWQALPNGTDGNEYDNTWNNYSFHPFSNYPSVRLALVNSNNSSENIYSNILPLNIDISPLQITLGTDPVAPSYTVPYNSTVKLEISPGATSPYTSTIAAAQFTYTWYNAKTGKAITTLNAASTLTNDSNGNLETVGTYSIPNFTTSGEYYLEITSSSALLPSGISFKSNTITVNVGTPTVSVAATSSTNYYGEKASVKYDTATNLTWGTNLSYEWQYSTNVNSASPTWTNEASTAWSKDGIGDYTVDYLLVNTWVRLAVYNGNTLVTTSSQVELTPITEPLTIEPTTTAVSSTNGVYTYKYGTNTSLQWSGWWSESKNYTFTTDTTYEWEESTDGGTKWTKLTWNNSGTPQNDSFDVTGTVMYQLVITNSGITQGSTSFTLTSSPITLNVNTQASVTIAASGTDITNSGSTYTIPTFGEQTTIKATLNNISSSYTGLTYTYQYLDNGTWTNWTGALSDNSITFNDVRNCEWRLVLTGASNLTVYSNDIYLQTTMPTLTITAKDGNSTGTSFAIGTVINVSASIGTLPNSLTAANGTTTVSVVGGSSANTSSYVLGVNTAFKATYTYNDSANAYYDFSVDSSILNIDATANPLTIDAYQGNATPIISNTYDSFDYGSEVNLGIKASTSWANYSVPTGYTLSYQWYLNGNQLKSSTKDTYTISSLTNSTSGQYQLVITCTNGDNNIFSVKSSMINITPSQVNFSVGYDDNGTFDDTTYTTSYGASGISLSIDTENMTGISSSILNDKSTTYQWQYYDGSKWTNIDSSNLAGATASSATTNTLTLSTPLLSTNTYRLQITIADMTFNSNSFSLAITPSTQTLTIGVKDQTAPYSSLSYDTAYTLEPTSTWWQDIKTNNKDLTCQWYVNYGNGTWTKVTSSSINDPDGDTTPFLAIKLMQDASYKLEITSSDSNFGTAGVLTSNIISLSIVPTDKGSFTIEATYDLSENGFTYDNTGSDVSINVPYDMWFPNITLSSSNSYYWKNQCNNPNGTYTYQLQAYQEAIPGDSSVSAGWVNFADYYKNLGVSTDWTTSDGKFTGFNLTSAKYSLKMSEMWRLAITNTYTGKVTYSNSIVINVANPDIIAQSSIPDVPTYTYQSINKQAAGNSFTVVVPHGQTKYVYLNPVWNTYVNVHYSSSWTTSAYLKQYEPLTSQWFTPTGSAITWTFGSKIVQQKNSSGTETSVTVYYVEFNNNTNYEGSTFDYQICLKPYKGDKPAILRGEVDANALPVTPVSQLFTVSYDAIQSLSISAIANGTSSATTEVNGQLGQGFSVSLSAQSVQDVKTIIAESEAQGQTDVHGYWVKVVNGQESVIQTAPNYKQIFCNAFLNSTEFETIMKSYIALGGYGNYLGNTATYDDFENWNVSFQELPADANGSGYGNNVFGILNDLVITATNKSQITVDNWSTSKNKWVAGKNVAAGSLFTWTLPYTWIDSNNQSGIKPTVSGTSSESTSMTLDYLTDLTAKAISGMDQSEFDNAFNTNASGGQEIFGFSVTDPSSNQSLVDFCPFNFTSSSGHSYSSFVKNITVTVNTSFVDNYINVPLTAIDNETIKYIVASSSYWTTNNNGEMVPSSNYPSTAIAPVESNLIYVTIPTLDNSTFSFSNFSALQSNWESENSSSTDNASDIAEQPFVQLSKNYYQVPFDQAITLSSTVTSYIANLSQIAPGYNFYIGYFFNGDLANWEQLLSTGTGLWGYNFQQVYNATSFDLNNFPITNNESIQLALFYTPDNNIFITSPDNSSQLQPKDLNVIWESSPLTFTIAKNMYATITPPSSTSAADATKAGFDRLNQTVYVLPATGYDNYVVSLDPNSSIYYWSQSENNEPYPSMSTSWINLQTFSEKTSPSAMVGEYSFNDKHEIINNSYGIIGEFLEIATFGNPYWSIYASWFPNLYSMFETWMSDGATAWPTVYNAWLNSNSYKDKGFDSSTYKYIPFMPNPIVYPIIKNGATNGDNIGKAIVDGTPINLNNQPFSRSWDWYVYGNFDNSSTITKKAGIGSDFQYSQKQETVSVDGKSVTETYLTSNISFNYNTNISDFISGSNCELAQSQYSYSAYAPLKFNIGAILGTEPFDEPIITRLVVFTLNDQTLNDTYYTNSDTFADVGLKVFKYVTPPLVILPAATAAKLTGASAIANEFAIPNSLK